MIDFSDRVVLITGAAGGIGSATARLVVELGGSVVAHDLAVTEGLVSLCDELAPGAHPLAADLSKPSAAAGLWHQSLAWRGRIDVLVNNAGIYQPARLDDSIEDWGAAWEKMLAICLVAPATLCREAIKTFREQRNGVIVNLASRAAWRGEDPDYWHYAAAKAGVVAMTKTIARQYGRDGVTAFAVAPGFVDTSFNQALVAEYGLEAFAKDTGIGEVARPDDIARVIAFLASGLARHATGATVDVNGASYVR